MLHLSAGEFRTGRQAEDSLLALCTDQQALHRGAEWEQEHLLATASTRMTVREDILSVLERATGDASPNARKRSHVIAPAFLPLAAAARVSVRPMFRSGFPTGSALLTFIPGRRSMHIALITPAGSTIRVSVQPPDKIFQSIEDYMRHSPLAGCGRTGWRQAEAAPGPELQSLTRTLYEALILPVEPLLKPGHASVRSVP